MSLEHYLNSLEEGFVHSPLEISKELPSKTAALLQLVPSEHIVQVFNQIIPFYVDSEHSNEIVATVSSALLASSSSLSVKLQM